MGRVAVAMSGGVDSTASAVILMEKGWDVTGITMEVAPGVGVSAVERAGKICHRLGIPHHRIVFHRPFEESVIEPFCREYSLGRTPNPCVLCNPRVKFGLLLQSVRDMGCSHMATGHYARIAFDESTGEYRLFKGVDPRKDQSYFLHRLGQDQLRWVIFPLGEWTKDQTRKMLGEKGIEIPADEESQEICFIPGDDYPAFLESRGVDVDTPGDIVDHRGEVLGRHRGLARYTIGQRRGLGIAHREPLYVTYIDREKNRLNVGSWEDLFARRFTLEAPSWVSGRSLTGPVLCRVRYRHREEPAMVESDSQGFQVTFDKPQRAITPGQSAVFYDVGDGNRVIGGGFIREVLHEG